MESPDLDSLLLAFDDKISNICAKLALLNVYSEEEKGKCLQVNNTLGNIQYMLHSVNQLLAQLENDLDKQTERSARLLQLVSDHLDYIETNYKLSVDDQKVAKAKLVAEKAPIIESKKRSPVNTKNSLNKNSKLFKTNIAKKSAETNGKVNGHKSIPSSDKSAPVTSANSSQDDCPGMAPISAQEYSTIPKYILGRLSLEAVNETVQAFNQTIANKYKFIKNYNTATANEADFKRFQEYKSHEMVETKGKRFCTINDIKALSNMKNDATLRKVLTCLRHCKRITELRGNPPKLIRYCLLK